MDNVNILYLADPDSIHDIRWINCFAANENFKCFVIVRKQHALKKEYGGKLDRRVRILGAIEDPSTVRLVRTSRERQRIKVLIEKYRINLFHILYAEPNALWCNAKTLFGIPMILTAHGTDVLKTIPDFFRKRDFLSFIVARQYRKAIGGFDAVLCTSQAQRESLARISPKAAHDISLVRMGVDFDQVFPKDEDPHLPAIDKPFVFMPRNMKPNYNHEFTLDGISLLDRAIRRKYAFVFINSADRADEYYQRIYRQSNAIDADIRFVPRQGHAELMALFMQCSLVVMNPTSDGSPATAMEAMACGKPVILPPLWYDEEIFSGAFFFNVWSPVALKDEIERVLSMPADQLKTVVKRNMEVVRLKADFRNEMTRVENIYRELMKKSYGVSRN